MIKEYSLLFIIILVWGEENVLSKSIHPFPDNNDKYIIDYDNTKLSRDKKYNEIELYFVTILGIIFSLLNTFGSLYIFYQTFIKFCNNPDSSLPISIRFPFYIAITDFGFSNLFTINLLYTLIHKRTIPNPDCLVVGVGMLTFILLNLFLIGIMAITTWLRVVREALNNFGRFDYKLWGILILLTVIVDIICKDDFGSNRYWCSTIPSCVSTPAILSSIIIIVLIIILFSYINVLKIIREIENLDENNLASNNNNNNNNNNNDNNNNDNNNDNNNRSIEHKVTLKIFQYVLVFILQYIPFLVYSVSRLIKIEHVTIYLLIVCAVNLGGIGNLYQYIKHEVSNPPVLPDLTDLTDLTDLSELPSASSFDSNHNQIKISINNN